MSRTIRIVSAAGAATLLSLMIPAGATASAPAGAPDAKGDRSTPIWPGIATGIGAAAALVFALGPSWRRSTPGAAGIEPGGSTGSQLPSAADLEVIAALDTAIAERRAQIEQLRAQSAYEARELDEVAAGHMRALRDAAWSAREELERLVVSQSRRIVPIPRRGAANVGVDVDVDAYRTAIEAFDRIRSLQQRALAELEQARSDGLDAFAAARRSVDALGAHHLARLDQAGSQWLARLEHAKPSRARRRRVSPPVVGVAVAVSLAVGAVALAIAGDNRRSDAGPQLRIEQSSGSPPAPTAPSVSVLETVPPTTVPPPETTETTAASIAPAPAPVAPAATAAPTEPPVVTAPPPPQFQPPASFPVLSGQVCAIVPSLC